MTMTGIKTTNDRSSTWQEFLLAAMSLVLVLVMTGQGVVQAAGIGMPMSQPDTVSGSAEMSEHDHHRSHEHDVPALTASDEDAATDMVAHHAGHADGSGCCPMSVCGSACSGVCSGTGVGVPVATAAPPTLSGLSRIGRAVTEDPVLARALGVPFRPPIPRHLAAG